MTAYFNPIGYRRHLTNYRIFRENLRVPLIAVECSLGGDFELTPGDADVLVQIPEGDVMWQKERLLNVALKSLPPECTAVAWLDCDIVFGDDDWPRRAMSALNNARIVHLYRERYHPPRDTPTGDFDTAALSPTATSTVHLIQSGAARPDLLAVAGLHLGWTNGLAWAGRRDALEKHGFYDACIIGSGDRAILCGALGYFEILEHGLEMTPARFDHYLSWARPFHDAVQGRVGCLDGAVFHLWHGNLADRHHATRHRDFARFDFDPYTDIVTSANGAWLWSSDKPDLHSFVRDFFRARNEDGEQTGPTERRPHSAG